MAEEIQIPGAGADANAKIRNPWGSSDSRSSRSASTSSSGGTSSTARCATWGRRAALIWARSPGNSVLAVTLGALIIVPAIVSEWTTSGRIERSQEAVA